MKYLKYFSPEYLYASYQRLLYIGKNRKKKLTIGRFSKLTNVEIGNYVFIGESTSLKNTSIGNHSYVSSNSRVINADIGKFCSIASFVTIGLGKHPTNYISTHPALYSNNKGFLTFSKDEIYKEYEPIKIENDVWIGSNCLIMDGVKIHNGAIVASGAVVTKDVLPYEIVGGVPAKHIRYRFDENIVNKLQEFRWWDKEIEWFEQNYRFFINPPQFIEKFIK